ncbi:putative AC transposase [Folsomia candida]|uniref:Putative AC transposase n=1 Tax=Folsomia candida TaxID=158441 RepID=A0A226D2H9_FOLCA|nr:putative AC transposase [Folsomia candida]
MENDGTSPSFVESNPTSDCVDNRESEVRNRKLRSEMFTHFCLTPSGPQYSCKYCSGHLKYEEAHGIESPVRNTRIKEPRFNKRPLNSSAPNQPVTQERLVNALTEFVLETDQAFIIVEEPSFRRLLGLLNPDIQIPGRTTMRSEISIRYQTEKEQLTAKLQEIPGKLSFILDCRTSSNQYAFQGVIVQGITREWELLSLPLDLTILNGSHTGENLATQLIKVLEDFNLIDRVHSITSDNASNMTTFFSHFKRLMLKKNVDFNIDDFRVRCLAHILNLVCQVALDSLRDMSEVEPNIYDLDPKSDGEMVPVLTKLHLSRGNNSEVRIFGLAEKELLLDIRTRWNSTLLMMERALEYQKPLECTLRMESNLIGWILTPEQWKMPFKDMTELMSKQDFPTISFYSLVYSKIFSQYGVDAKRKLKAIDPKTGRTFPTWLRNAAKEANDKLERYYPSSKGLMYIAGTVLDPRCKTEWFSSVRFNSKDIENDITKYWQSFYAHAKISMITRLLDTSRNQRATVSPNALDNGALGWWKNHESDYPTLSKMARDFLTAAGAGVPVERLFSSGSTLLTPKRQKMSPSTIQECICTRGWIKANYQERFKQDLCVAVADKMKGDNI